MALFKVHLISVYLNMICLIRIYLCNKPHVPVFSVIFGPIRNGKGSIESSFEIFSTLKITLEIKTVNHFDYIVEDRDDLQTDNKFLDKLPFSLY